MQRWVFWPLKWETALLEASKCETEVQHPTVQLNLEIKAMCSWTMVLNLNYVEDHFEDLIKSAVILQKKKEKKKERKKEHPYQKGYGCLEALPWTPDKNLCSRRGMGWFQSLQTSLCGHHGVFSVDA